MGVMSCARKDCDNVMCDDYLDNFGYICYECKEEFNLFAISKGKRFATVEEFQELLEEFREVDKQTSITENENNISVEKFFEQYSR